MPWDHSLSHLWECLHSDGAETAAIDGLILSWSENISVSFCLRTPGYGWTLWCALGLLVGGAIQVLQLQLQLVNVWTVQICIYVLVDIHIGWSDILEIRWLCRDFQMLYLYFHSRSSWLLTSFWLADRSINWLNNFITFWIKFGAFIASSLVFCRFFYPHSTGGGCVLICIILPVCRSVCLRICVFVV